MALPIDPNMERLAVGLMSGTSVDGIDAALVRIEGAGTEASVTLLANDTLRYSPSVRQRILACMGPEAGNARELTLLDAYMGELFAHAVLRLCQKANTDPRALIAVGSHGQTLFHHPAPIQFPGFSVTGTLQAGNPALIAERTGATVVSGFRQRDMAAGGQGAPLAPYLDYLLYHHRSRSRIALNIGGIANVTALTAGAGLDGVLAFDTGPGNALLDLAAYHYSGGKKTYDVDGAMALGGKADAALLAALQGHPFLRKAPPKSADKDDFGPLFLDGILSRFSALPAHDVMATLAAFTVSSIATGILEFCIQRARYEEIIVSGGGAKNPLLMEGLQEAFPKLTLSTSDDYGIPSGAKEAVLMAVLADATLHGWPGNVPSATGAKAAVVLGEITPGARFFERE